MNATIEDLEDAARDERDAIEKYLGLEAKETSAVMKRFWHGIAEQEMEHLQAIEDLIGKTRAGGCVA